jgi:hypothetical protein
MKKYITQRCDQTGKIYFAENIRIVNKGIHGRNQAIGKICPYDAARHIEKDGRDAIG